MDSRPFRLVLRMVASLHLRGYQGLRIAPGMSPSGMHWRCTITPSSNVSREHGARVLHWNTLTVHYTSGMGDRYFGWDDAAISEPGELGRLFVERFPAIAAEGRDSDWAYAGWFREMLHLTYPDRFPIAYADWDLPSDCLTTVGGGSEIRIPLPPPGLGPHT